MEFAVSTTDCRSCEHGSQMKAKRFLNNQMTHLVGVRQSASTQVTDIHYKTIGKAAGEETMVELRRLHMLKALKAKKQSAACSERLDLMQTCIAI